LKEINDLIKEESSSFKDILENGANFNHNFNTMCFRFNLNKGFRNVFTTEELIQSLLLFCQRIDDIISFVNELKIILTELVFDEDIAASMEELSDGFILRKGEIIYHLYCIYNEIPKILCNGYVGYENIGRQMSIVCSPERNRDKVNEKLKKDINGKSVNCELHTKMKRLTDNAPDRIYFCPSVPDGTGEVCGKIFVYKITKHA